VQQIEMIKLTPPQRNLLPLSSTSKWRKSSDRWCRKNYNW